MGDVEVESLLPPELEDWEPAEGSGAASLASQLCAALEPFDARTALRVGEMLAEGMVPRQLSPVRSLGSPQSLSLGSPPSSQAPPAPSAGASVVPMGSPAALSERNAALQLSLAEATAHGARLPRDARRGERGGGRDERGKQQQPLHPVAVFA